MTEPHDVPIRPEELDAIRREAIEFSGIGLYRYRFDGIVLFMDRGAMRILDLEPLYASPDEVVGRDIADLLVYEGPRGLLRSRIRELGRVRDLEYPFQTLTGKSRWAAHDSYLVVDERTGEESIQVIIKEITERKHAELALAEERERLAVTLRSIGDGVITTDLQGRVTLLNRVAENLTGWRQAEALGLPLTDVFHIINEHTRTVCENPVEKVLHTGGVVGLANHTALVARDGRERVIADSGAPIRDTLSRIIGVVLVFRDVTAQYRAEAELTRIDRLEALGVLAGGLAHDFNNLLATILGNVGLARMYAPQPVVNDLLGQAERATLRAKDLTQQLLTFARGGSPVRQSTGLEALVREAAGFALHGSKSRLQCSFPPDLWAVDVDGGQIAQVVQNLCLNADQAMPAGGEVTVDAENVLCGAADGLPLAAGRYVRVRIRDTGVGIPQANLKRIFDPYFTTKAAGTGLGLTICHSIIAHHEGHLAVSSQEGVGTTFSMWLPASAPAESVAAPVDVAPPSGAGRVLIMDDEEMLRDLVARMLAHLGYETSVAADGAAAVRMYQEALEAGSRFDLVLLDLTVPGGMGGAEAVRRLRALDPAVRAVASSGYSSDPIIAHFRDYGFVGALAKPYQMADLARAVLQAIRGA